MDFGLDFKVVLDLGLIVCGIAAALAIIGAKLHREDRADQGRGRWQALWLPHLMLAIWATSMVGKIAQATMASVVFMAVVADLVIAGAAVSIVTHDPKRIDARLVGGISMALMPAHWAMSMSQGQANWTLYAAGCNAGFVLQCLIVGGWLDGLGRGVSRILARISPLSLFRARWP